MQNDTPDDETYYKPTDSIETPALHPTQFEAVQPALPN
jgi:hypothetical protein